ncbi:MAG: hypothetical protein JWO98_3791 [Frankiales bacterium]|nr:hypothetical protein [Frankiales bacterium]
MNEHDRPGRTVAEGPADDRGPGIGTPGPAPRPREATSAAEVPGEEGPGEEAPGEEAPADEARAAEEGDASPGEGDPSAPERAAGEASDAADTGDGGGPVGGDGDPTPSTRRRRRNRIAAAVIGVLCLLLGFAFAVQVRSTDTGQQLAGAREEDLVRILDDLNAREERLRQQIAEQRTALDQLGSSDSRSATALQEARQRAQAIGILNGTVAAQGPGLRMQIRDPGGAVRVADLLDAIEELRGAGAETMQIDGVRVGVSTAVTGDPGSLSLDGRPITAPYEVLVIGSPQDLQTAMNIPGGVVQRVTGRGGSVDITQEQQVVVDALRPLDQPQYASPKSGG